MMLIRENMRFKVDLSWIFAVLGCYAVHVGSFFYLCFGTACWSYLQL